MKRYYFLSLITLVGFFGIWARSGSAESGSGSEEIVGSVKAKGGATGQGNFLSLTDIHFNPFYDTVILKHLIAKPASDWESIFESSGYDGSYGYYGWQTDLKKIDTNYKLLKSALNEAVNVNPDPDFIIVNGDFLAHQIEQAFIQFHGTDQAVMRDFLAKTMEFVNGQIAKRFPGVPIYPSVGNNDSFCGDYEVRASGSFLERTAPVFAENLKGLIDTAEFNDSYKKGGYFIANSPNNPKHKIITLNTIMLSIKYLSEANNVCGTLPPESKTEARIQTMFRWLGKKLGTAKANGDKVWLMLHIPPGLNAYSSTGGTPTYYYKEAYTMQYLDTVNKYSDVIVAQFGGHTHMDNFIVINGHETPTSYVHISPGITPVFDNNPGFLEYTYEPSSGEVIDYDVHGFQDVETSTSSNWSKEYSFSTTYNQNKLSPDNLKAVYTSFLTDPAAKKHYIDYYVVEDTTRGSIDDSNWKYYFCAFGNQTAASYSACVAKMQ